MPDSDSPDSIPTPANTEPTLNVRSMKSDQPELPDRIVDAAFDIAGELLARKAGVVGRYRFEKELARGGMGVVNVVYDQDLGRISAMKVLPADAAAQHRNFREFVSEARLTAQLEHPNIVPIHEIGALEESGCPFYTMKKVEGESLKTVLDQMRRSNVDYLRKFSRHRLLDVFRKVCDAVAYAHSRKIIHRDLKPDNIMVGRFGEVLLMDWGLAKMLGTTDSVDESASGDRLAARTLADATLTEDGMIKGSPAYMSPEQAFGEVDDVDERTDIFLLGATLYHMFTFHPPYESTDMVELISAAEKADFIRPGERTPGVRIPQTLENIIMKAMAPLKEDRFQTVDSMIDEIDAYLSGRRVCDRRRFVEGDTLISRGEKGTETYILISGSVDVFETVNDKMFKLVTLGPGEIVGEMASITHTVRSATVIAAEQTEVLLITRELMADELQKLPPWLERIVISMADRVRLLDARIHPHRCADYSLQVVTQLHSVFDSQAHGSDSDVSICTDLKALCEELYLQTGLERLETEPLLKEMVKSEFLVAGPSGLQPRSLGQFARFNDFYRMAAGVRGARAVNGVNLSSEEEPRFRNLRRKLRECCSRVIGKKLPPE